MTDSARAEHFDLVICGASFVGLALARALSQAIDGALHIAVVDRRAPQHTGEPVEDARAFALAAGSKYMLETLGAWRDIEPEAQPMLRIEITDTSLTAGVRPPRLTYDNVLANGDPASFVVPAGALARALSHTVERAKGVTLIAPADISTCEQAQSRVTIVLADGRQLTTPLLVAADGRASKVSRDLGMKTVRWAYAQTGIVTTIAHDRPHNACAVQHFLPGGPFALLPLIGDRCCVTWSEQKDEALRILALDNQGFLDEIEQRVGGRLGSLTLTGPRQSWPLEMHLARRYVGPRFAIVGDAAHGVHPIAGQGLNLALRDVAALFDVVMDACRLGLDIGNALTLESYERWRRFDSAFSAAAFDGLNRLFSRDAALLRSAREFGLGVVDRLPGLKQMFVNEAAGLTGKTPRLLRKAAV